jgi:hypothetical protein
MRSWDSHFDGFYQVPERLMMTRSPWAIPDRSSLRASAHAQQVSATSRRSSIEEGFCWQSMKLRVDIISALDYISPDQRACSSEEWRNKRWGDPPARPVGAIQLT